MMASCQLPPPDAMVCTGSVATNWKIFKEAYNDFATATELTNKDDEIQAATLKTVMGKECRQILSRLELSNADKKKPNKILEKLEEHFAPTRNVLYERYLFHSAQQQAHETVDQCMIRLRHLAESCKFGVLHNEMVRDRLVLGCRDKGAKARLFREKDCTLKKALEALQISEATQEQLKDIGSEDNPIPINAVSQSKKGTTYAAKQRQHKNPYSTCKYCGGQHEPVRTQCPAYGKSCHNCGKANHFYTVCLRGKHLNKAPKPIAAVQESPPHTSESEEEIYAIEQVGTVKHNHKGQFFAALRFDHELGSTTIDCQLDTGATCNVMSKADVCKILHTTNPPLQPETSQLKCYDNMVINTLGVCTLQGVYQNNTYPLHFKVIEGDQKPLLSGNTCIDLGLITMHTVRNVTDKCSNLIAQYHDVFEGLGCMGDAYHIDIDSAIPPVQHLPRRVPVAMKEPLKCKLSELTKRGIIIKVEEPTPWISNMVAIMKPNKLRLCIDPRDLNRAIKRPKYQMPTLEEILPTLSKAKIFTVLDAKEGFYQVKLDDNSSYLTTFWTPFGRYRYLRMPFGISSAPEEFQRRMHAALQGLSGVEVIADDILVYGCGDTEEEYRRDHDTNLRHLLQRARERNLKLNKKKLKLCLSEVSYMGHKLTREGLCPDPAKVKAIIDMPRPDNKKAVERFLGCLQYLSCFMPQLATVAAPLRLLTEQSAIFTWQTKQEEAFQSLKTMITNVPVLKFYDVKEEVTLQCDASEKGLGGTLLQKGQPVAFISRSLSKTEQQYAQIEKECLAIVFACERFNQYIHGRELISVQTDHRPLVPIFSKPIYNAPKRLQRMLLRLQKYTLKVCYCPGKEMYVADMLSRAFLQEPPSREKDYQLFQMSQEMRVYKEIEEIDPAKHARLSAQGLETIREATIQDDTLKELATTIQQGWPDLKKNVPMSIRAFWPYRDELVVDNNIVFKGTKVVIPNRMRALMLQRSHISHQGPEACVRRARDAIFWPGMASEIRHLASQCATCNDHSTKQQKEPLLSTEIPTSPWAVLAQDLFTLAGKSYLITVDYYSDFWELDALTDTSSESIVKHTKAHFARYGIPEKVITDNGPQFRAQSYEEFASQWGFNHVTSSPYHSQGNGKAEATVKIAKNMLKKVNQDNQDMNLAILAWQNTPTEEGHYSPVQKLQSRRTRTQLPTISELLKPELPQGIEGEIQRRRLKAKQQYDRAAKELPVLKEGQVVRIQPVKHQERWRKGTVLKKVNNRSYLVKTANGYIYRRNRRHLRQTKERPDDPHRINDSADDELAIPFTEDKTQNNEQPMESLHSRRHPTDCTVTRSGRACVPPNRLKDYIRHS